MPDTWKEKLQSALKANAKAHKAIEKIKDKQIQKDIGFDLANNLADLEPLTWQPQLDADAQRTITIALEYLDNLHTHLLDQGIISPDD